MAGAAQLRFERRDQFGLEQPVALAFEAAGSFGEHVGEAARPLAQVLDPYQRVAEVEAAHGREPVFGGHDLGVERRQLGADGRLVTRQAGALAGQRGQSRPL